MLLFLALPEVIRYLSKNRMDARWGASVKTQLCWSSSMSEQMLKFVNKTRRMPEKRPAEPRVRDFEEIFTGFKPEPAVEQASRCSQCGIPYCQIHCPVNNHIPDWLKLTVEGRMEEAYELSSRTNNLPEVCGRICPQDRLCEGNCVIEQAGHGTVTIGSIETYITETAFSNGWVKPPSPKRELKQSVGIIGAGPAGMAAAEQLRRAGFNVDVYARYDRVGGLLVYGIPGFKLEKPIVERRAQLLKDGGISFHLEFEVGRDASLEGLRSRHDAVLICTGVYKLRNISVPGVGFPEIKQALDYLTASNRKGLGDAVPQFDSGSLNAAGKRVVVIGGGDTAMDCVRTAVRQGAKSVKCLYRRDRQNMPGSMREVAHAEEEGVEFVWLTSPEAFLGDSKLEGVRAIRMRLGSPDPSGRQTPRPMAGSSHVIDADLAINALGFDPEDIPSIFDAPDLAVSQWGTIQIDFKTMMTSLQQVTSYVGHLSSSGPFEMHATQQQA